MALTYSSVTRTVMGTQQVVEGLMAFDSSYPTGGEAFSLAGVGVTRLDQLDVFPGGGYVFEWDRSTTSPKVLAYYGDNNNASDGPLIQVPDTTNLSTVTNVRFRARGA